MSRFGNSCTGLAPHYLLRWARLQLLIYCHVTNRPVTWHHKTSTSNYVSQFYGSGTWTDLGWFFPNVTEGDSVVPSGGRAGLESPGELHSQDGNDGARPCARGHSRVSPRARLCTGQLRGPGSVQQEVPRGLVSKDPTSALSHLANQVPRVRGGNELHLSVGRAAKTAAVRSLPQAKLLLSARVSVLPE